MNNRIKRFFRRGQIKTHYIRSKFDIVIRNKFPHIKISEKHEKKIKWVLRLLTIIGIASSVIAFSAWYYSLEFAVALLIIEQLFEQIIFTHHIMLVQPLPQCWDGSKWTGMLLVTDGKSLYLGFGFSDKAVGIDFFNTVLAWNDGAFENIDNIQLTLVREDKNNYSVHIYPTVQREFIRVNCADFEKKFDRKINAGKELEILATQMCFCKVFPVTPNCAYNYLLRNHSNIYIQIYDTSQINENDPRTYQNATPMDERTILFRNIKVCDRKKLSPKTDVLEYYNVPKF
ncbi:MAG: hypothetical protein ACQGTM_15775 [bacterium]